jgi:excisionase family DNA binding protein
MIEKHTEFQVLNGVPKRYVRVKELSYYLSITASNLYVMVHRGEIPYHKKGKRLMFDLREIDSWIAKDKFYP